MSKKKLVFEQSPYAKTKLTRSFRQYLADIYAGEKLYLTQPRVFFLGSPREVESLVSTTGTLGEQKLFFDLVKKKSNSLQPVNEAIFEFVKQADPEWYDKHKKVLNKKKVSLV